LETAASQAPCPVEAWKKISWSVFRMRFTPPWQARWISRNSGARKSITGRSIARSTLSGMLVGPGLLKNWRPRGFVFSWAVNGGSGVRKVAHD
jgi:hypothetical protein